MQKIKTIISIEVYELHYSGSLNTESIMVVNIVFKSIHRAMWSNSVVLLSTSYKNVVFNLMLLSP